MLKYTRLHDVGKTIVLVWAPGHVGIRGNEAVDRKAKEAVKITKKSSQPVPYTDLKHKINTYAKDLFQKEWDQQTDNKLHDFYPVLDDIPRCYFSNRKEETVFTRVRTGHSFFTHGFLLKGEEPPHCYACDERFSIKHILIDCWDLHDTRKKFYTAESMKVLFRDVPPDILFDFLKEIGIYNRL